MKVFKRFTRDQHGYKKNQIIPPRLEKQFPNTPYHVRFKHQGKCYWIKLTGALNRREAERMARAEYARVVHVDARYRHLQGEMPFGDLIQRYLAEHKHKPSFLWIDTRCRRLLAFFGNRSIGTIRREDTIRLRDQLKGEITRRGTGRSNADVNRHLEVLRSALNYAVNNEWLAINPIRRGVMMREREHTIRFFSEEEIERILDTCVGPLAHIRPMLEFCLLTGSRTAEMLMLKWEDVDFDGSRIHFRNTKTAQDRFVKMGIALRRLFYDLPRFEGCDYVFPNPLTKRPYGHYSKKYGRFIPGFPRKVWQKIRKQAMLTDAGAVPYTLRRTAATILAKNLGLHEAQEILGHANISTTRKYAAVTSDTYDRAAEVLEGSIKNERDRGRLR